MLHQLKVQTLDIYIYILVVSKYFFLVNTIGLG